MNTTFRKIALTLTAAIVTSAAISCTKEAVVFNPEALVQSQSSEKGFLTNRKFFMTGLTIVKIHYTDKKQLTTLNEMGMDVWTVQPGFVIGQLPEGVLEKVKKTNLKVEMLSPREGYSIKNTFDPQYHTYDEMLADLRAFAGKYPSLAKLHDIGDTWEKKNGKANRDLWAMRITGKGEGSQKPGIVFFGNHHARELVTVEIPLLLINHLLENYGKDPDITYLVDNREIWIVPMVNPDGHARAAKGENWRKSMNDNEQTNPARMGVDLNRNYGYQWNTGGSSSNISSETYHGKHAFSEPETQATRDFMKSRKNLKIMMSYHSFSNLILWPWGNTYNPAPEAALFEKVGGKLGAMSGYKPEQASDLYITSGTTDDWSYGELGMLSFTTEIGSWGDGFDPPYSRVPKFWQENLPGAMYLIRLAGEPTSAFGPDIEAVSSNGSGELSIRFNKKYANNVAKVEYFTGKAGKPGTGTSVPVTNSARAFSIKVSENAKGTVYLRAQGPDGKWGPVSAGVLK